MRLTPDEMLARACADLFWVPPDATVIDRPDLCVVSCPRPVPVLNTVFRATGRPDHVPRLVAEVRRLHAGRPARWMVGPFDAGEPLEDSLKAAGYTLEGQYHGATSRTDRTLTPVSPDIVVRPVTDMQGLQQAFAVTGAAFGTAISPTRAELDLYLAQCTGPDARVLRVVAYDLATGEPLSAGGLTMFPDLGFGLLWAGGTVPQARGKGAYTKVLEARLHHAARAGLSRVGLYARTDSSLPIVEALGFDRHAPLRIWEHPG
ncbi:MAG: hypothetical protein D6798_10905 [Deltaproteobacteria bacterium]|nr:MAG: hypothetical protein D6798_10905 [Deltaproteobacteria bacterium]